MKQSDQKVFCNNRNLDRIPEGIPATTRQLYLQDNMLTSTIELESSLQQLKNLVSLRLYNNRLTRIPKLDSTFLLDLRINQNRIEGIEEDSFQNTPNLIDLQLAENRLRSSNIAQNAFRGLLNLENVSLRENDLTIFPINLPASLRKIDLSNNRLLQVDRNSVQDLKLLEELNLEKNQLADGSFDEIEINQHLLSKLRRLKELNLSFNQLRNIPMNLSETIVDLMISHNNLNYIFKNQLIQLKNLRALDLGYNRLKSAEKNAFESLTSLNRLEISGNSWRCDCYLLDFHHYLQRKGTHLGSREKIKCSTSAGMDHVELETAPDSIFECTHHNHEVSVGATAIRLTTRNINDLPPFAEFKLSLANDEDGLLVYEDVLNLTETSRTISNLRPAFNYRLCFYNCYLFDEKNYPLESCQIIRTGPSVTNSDETNVQNEATRQKDDIIIGTIVGCFFIGVVVAAVLYLNFHKNRRSQKKEVPTSLPPPPAYSRPSHMTDLSNKRLTVDAAREFDVTLLPMPYDGGGKSSRSSNLSNQFLTNTVDSVIYQEMEHGTTTPSLIKSHLV